ncbi:MAG: molybdopterin-dependent oxidoreductase, partial [Pseudomonadota bacterium]
MLKKKTNGVANGPRLSSALGELAGKTVDRRAFLKNSGLAIGGLAAVGTMASGRVAPAEAAASAGGKIEIKKSVCTHCSVGCTVVAEVQDGVWVGQEPGTDSPFNLGAHCAKGAAVREHAHGERRLKYPTKLVGGKWKRISWDQAIDEIGDKMLQIRKASGPDSVYWLGSAKFNNEQAYLFRKFYAFWGTNNGDHQARICHSTTVAGVANTWGYGAMTNSYNDIHNSRSMILIGSNPTEAHPVSLLHLMKAKEQNNAAFIVCDPRFTRTAAHATEYVRMRPGTDVAMIWGILWHIFENGWEDKQYIDQRVWGLEYIREEVAKWGPEETERVTGIPGSQLRRVARTLVTNKPGTLIWCMGGTQHTNGNNNTRAYCILQLALGNIGRTGGGANIFRGHDNVQGATDMCVLSHSLPGYYGLKAGSWKHWSRVWDVDYEWVKGRFESQKMMESKGIPVSRWVDGVLEDKAEIDQTDNLRAMVFWGHAPNSQTRGAEMKKAFEKLDLLVVIDPYPTVSAVYHDRTDGVYLLPASTQFETYGSVTASNRSLQWREKVVEPLFESLPDHVIMAKFAKKFGFDAEYFKNIKVAKNAQGHDEPVIEDVTREFNKGMWTIGYTGHSPERIKAHMKYQHTFDKTTLQARGGPLDGEYYGLPWPCWGTADMKHPGTPNLYDPSKPVAEGGLNFRARFGVKAPDEWGGGNLLAEGDVEGASYPVGNELKGGHPEFTMAMLQKLGWAKDLTAEEVASIKKVAGMTEDILLEIGEAAMSGMSEDQKKAGKVNWKTDLSGGIQRVAIKHGCAPFGNAKARTVVWPFPDPVPLHREPLYTNRRDLLDKYATYSDRKMYRLPTRYASIQEVDHSTDYPMVLTSGRLVEYEGGGDETRSNKWLAELQQDMFVEINPVDANT